MKTKEAMQEDAGLVRDVIALAEIKFPADHYEANLRDAMFRKSFAVAPQMELQHIRRLNEALCAMEFPSETALALRRQVQTCLAQFHKLKEYRNLKLPVVRPPQSGGKA